MVYLTDPQGGSSLLNYIQNKLNYIVYAFLWDNSPMLLVATTSSVHSKLKINITKCFKWRGDCSR